MSTTWLELPATPRDSLRHGGARIDTHVLDDASHEELGNQPIVNRATMFGSTMARARSRVPGDNIIKLLFRPETETEAEAEAEAPTAGNET
jgi:hypothetical protein